jgi:hypothetical protein
LLERAGQGRGQVRLAQLPQVMLQRFHRATSWSYARRSRSSTGMLGSSSCGGGLTQVVPQSGELALLPSALQFFQNPHRTQLRKGLQQRADLRLVFIEMGRPGRPLIPRRDLARQRPVDRPPLKTEVAGNRPFLPTLRQIQPPGRAVKSVGQRCSPPMESVFAERETGEDGHES